MDYPSTWAELRKDMEGCEQSRGQNMIQHGNSVWEHYAMIDELLSCGTEIERNQVFLKKLKLPDWFFEFEEGLAWNRHSSSHFHQYLYWHDCGKPYCQTIDEDGKQHFPDHARVSSEVWSHLHELNPKKHNTEKFIATVSELMRRDMEIHTIKAKDIEHFCRDETMAVTLLLAGLAEIHANASMFGGFESTSFKIKYKQINRRGKAICKYLKLNEKDY